MTGRRIYCVPTSSFFLAGIEPQFRACVPLGSVRFLMASLIHGRWRAWMAKGLGRLNKATHLAKTQVSASLAFSSWTPWLIEAQRQPPIGEFGFPEKVVRCPCRYWPHDLPKGDAIGSRWAEIQVRSWPGRSVPKLLACFEGPWSKHCRFDSYVWRQKLIIFNESRRISATNPDDAFKRELPARSGSLGWFLMRLIFGVNDVG